MTTAQTSTSRALGRGDRTWVAAGLLVSLLLIPVLHLAVVDLESKTGNQAAYLRQVDDRHLPIVLAGTAGLVLVVGLLTFLLGLRRSARNRPLLADVCTAVGGLAVLGLALGFLCAVIGAQAAHERFPFAVVRTLGTLAESASAVLLPALAGPAVLVSVLSLVDALLPRALGYVSAAFAVILTAVAVLAPSSGSLPAVAWLLVSSLLLLVAARDPRDQPAG